MPGTLPLVGVRSRWLRRAGVAPDATEAEVVLRSDPLAEARRQEAGKNSVIRFRRSGTGHGNRPHTGDQDGPRLVAPVSGGAQQAVTVRQAEVMASVRTSVDHRRRSGRSLIRGWEEAPA